MIGSMRAVRILRRLVTFLAVAGAACAAAPAAGNPAIRIAPGVRVGDTVVAWLTSEPARAELRRGLSRPLIFVLGERRWEIELGRFGLEVDVDAAIREALTADPGEGVAARVEFDEESIRKYVRRLAPSILRRPRQAQVVELDSALRPVFVAPRRGYRLDRPALERKIAKALRLGLRRPTRLPVTRIEPRQAIRTVIVIRRETKRLELFDGRRLVRRFRIATGTWEYPTPLGRFDVVTMQRHPWWYPPPSDWARGLSPVPPGPGNPLGTRWMGLSASSVGIHGTPDAASVGYSASHGCIRMYVPDAEWLFERVEVGTPVFIVSA
jgi:lipoprotein-anchoring transpeptidase ErfK/SrfK